jgi:hypothetical protein
MQALKKLVRPAARLVLNSRLAERFRKSRRRFERELNGHMAGLDGFAPRKGASDPNLAALLENGFVLLPRYYSEATIMPLHDAAHAMLERVRTGQAPDSWRTLDYGEDGIYRLLDCGAQLPAAKAILENAYVRGLVDAYLNGTPVRAYAEYIDYKPDLKHDHTSVLHMDNWRSQPKVFTLLSDVGPHNAPMVYWSKTHRDAEWRRRFDFAFWSGDPVGINGCYPASLLRERRAADPSDGPREIAITAPAGSVLIADTRGVHRASCLIAGYRLEIVQKFAT